MSPTKAAFFESTQQLPTDIQLKIWDMYMKSLMSPRMQGFIKRWNTRRVYGP
jgi:uncharacterized protein Usg